ncbi:4-hydroxy-3-methylbut-2-enyl diphosphate reductase [Escherichia coli]|nr:4-hydroxy-3-methylbut-2-enyl diphosphate reductase [Escherichia coli]PYH16751.1 4-hydroxy-3-methylbut-2-enyl diphosphate reductase [Escherichia coli]
MSESVQSNSAVLVHFTLKLDDGTTAESTRNNGKPALFRLGDASLSEGLEQHLLGLKVGDKTTFSLEPDAAFGVPSPDLIQYFSRREFMDAGEPEIGAIMLFTAMDGSEMPGVIREINGDSITVDFFCAGVDRAISIVENALAIYGAPIYVRHEVVHNRYVVDSLRERGAIFIEQISEVPDGAILIFSAHGVSQAVRNEAKSRDLTVFDATCPLVTKVHMEVARASRRGEESILIGHAGHPEVEGTMGQYSNPEGGMYLVESPDDVWKLTVKNEEKLSFMTQTTLSVDDTSDVIDALRKRFPKIVGPRKDDICYATTNRQEAVRALAEQAEVVLVVGSKNSSNSNRLAELAQRMGKSAFLIDDAKDIQEEWVKEVKCVGVTAGASAPDILVQNVVARLQQLGGGEAIPLEGREENIVFEVPKELRVDIREVD